ncbi:MAG: hypothetical protein V8S08_02240 [Lachnoclostridium sp.]
MKKERSADGYYRVQHDSFSRAQGQCTFGKGRPGTAQGDMVICHSECFGGQYVLHRIVKFDSAEGVYFAGRHRHFIHRLLPRECIFALVKAVKRKENWIRPGDFWWDFFADSG